MKSYLFFFRYFTFLIWTSVALFPTLSMSAAPYSYSCSIRQGFDFDKSNQDMIGYITRMRIVNVDLTTDIEVTNPLDFSSSVKVFGVLSNIVWAGGKPDSIQMHAQISFGNRNTLHDILHKELRSREVDFALVVFDYDLQENRYFRSFHTDGKDLCGLIKTTGTDLHISVSDDSSHEIVAPQNFAFAVEIIPREKQQEIHIAVSLADKFMKYWSGLRVRNR